MPLAPQDLARSAVETYVRTGRLIDPPPAADLPAGLTRRAGAFVCMKRAGQLRGCVGTVFPQTESVAHEIIRTAVQAAVSDPRFPPVRPEELAELDYTVDVLSEPEPVGGPQDLDPRRYGCIVRASGGRLGLLLPDLDGVDSVEQQLGICRQKGGIGPDEAIELERFTVTRYPEQRSGT